MWEPSHLLVRSGEERGVRGFVDVAVAQEADLRAAEAHGVKYLRYWVDDKDGDVFCPAEALDADLALADHREPHALVADHVFEVVGGQRRWAPGRRRPSSQEAASVRMKLWRRLWERQGSTCFSEPVTSRRGTADSAPAGARRSGRGGAPAGSRAGAAAPAAVRPAH